MPAIYPINASNAREFAAKARIARAANKLKQEQDRELAAKARAEAEENAANGSDFLARMTNRVRVQLERLDVLFNEQMDKPTLDPKALDQLASAKARLSEQERILSGRPLPGSRRPPSEKRTRKADSVEPIE